MKEGSSPDRDNKAANSVQWPKVRGAGAKAASKIRAISAKASGSQPYVCRSFVQTLTISLGEKEYYLLIFSPLPISKVLVFHCNCIHSCDFLSSASDVSQT